LWFCGAGLKHLAAKFVRGRTCALRDEHSVCRSVDRKRAVAGALQSNYKCGCGHRGHGAYFAIALGLRKERPSCERHDFGRANRLLPPSISEALYALDACIADKWHRYTCLAFCSPLGFVLLNIEWPLSVCV
jgi:hypothetical protein